MLILNPPLFLGICPVLFYWQVFFQDVNSNLAHILGDICPILFFLQVFIKMSILNIQPTFLGIYVQSYSSSINMSILKKP